MAEQQYDTEITLGIGKLLGLFFVLVVLCGIFLGLGYTLGRSSAKQDAVVGTGTAPSGSISTTAKPGATQGQAAAKASDAQVAAAENDLTYYKTVQQKEPDQQLQKPEPPSQGATADLKQAPEIRLGGGYVVQVAAVSKKEDAEALQQALQRKQYPVVVTPGAGDKLFHVQIGPFADAKDADAMKSRLAGDGYNAIVKK